ncbi:ABC transporter ATP-binding protein [Halorussus salinus]|uniref:ABC transporter ATP-binding protein n=1 Tax=Halorussus salinus TaxID=1364935 RepID=UPI001EE44E17|nr:ABC transporter ATP-binding protein [Halorussus salinus]
MDSVMETQRRSNSESSAETAEREEVAAEGPAFAVDDLTMTFGGGDVTAVDGVSFEIEPGSVVGVLGPNGAGKTTTLKTMLGTLVPDSGTVTLGGREVHENLAWTHERVGAMFEGSRDAYWRLTVRENLEFFARLNGVRASDRRDRHDALLQRLDLAEKANVPVRKLSRGQKQKVAIASTLSRAAEVALLDEPTLGLDVETSLKLQDEIRSLVADQDLTVVLTSHDMDVIQNICDRVIVLSEGRVIADDSVADLLDFFRTTAYRIRLDAPVPSSTVETLRSRFDVTDHDQYGEVHEFEITYDEDVHSLSDELREIDCTVRTFETIRPDLGDVFLEMTTDDTTDV